MKDCTGKEIEVGQLVAFTVGCDLKTGTVVKIGQRTRYGRKYDSIKVQLSVVEYTGGRCIYRKDEQDNYVQDNQGRYIFDRIGGNPKTTRDVLGSERIVIMRNKL